MPRRPLAIAAAALLLAGCGGPGDEEQVRAALGRFERAAATRDYQELCDSLLSSALIAKLDSVGLPCEVALSQGLGRVRAPKLTVLAVAVKNDRATARVRSDAAGERPSTDTVALRKEKGSWRISDLAGASGG